MGSSRVAVLLPLPFDHPFDYAQGEGMALQPGDLVSVPLGGRMVVGAVWDDPPGETAPERLRAVGAIMASAALPADLRRFIDWVADYTMAPRGAVLALALKANLLEPVGAARGRRRAGIDAAPDPDFPGPDLSEAQAIEAATLVAAVAAGQFSVTLLEGVTGSGKTEVYLEAVAAALRQGQQALVLLPEIALSAQFTARLQARFGAAPTVWHSALSPAKRRAAWQGIAAGQKQLVLGARSALFLPFPDLGVVVVDEEHEAAYKQEDGVIYHARDMAVVRARLAGCAAVLASATPSLESSVNAARGRYRQALLGARHGGAAPPAIEMVDLRRNPPERGRFLSPVLVAALAATLADGGQAMLFLNRRGYAPLMLCRSCGHRMACPHCTAWLVAHRAQARQASGHAQARLLCHHCGHVIRVPVACPACKAADSLVPIGPGVERIAEEVRAVLPEARSVLMTSDVVGSAEQAGAVVRAVETGSVDVLIGTQMMAKGWHFPQLTLVGVVDADLGLAGGDLRAAERSAQLLHQVAGRVGRAERPGRALLQTWQPEHPVMLALASGDLAGFRQAEAALRMPGHWPPYGRLAALIVSGDQAEPVAATCRALAQQAPVMEGVVVLGPAPAVFAMLRGRHRWRFLIKAERGIAVQSVLRDWLSRVQRPRSVRVIIDIDPISFL